MQQIRPVFAALVLCFGISGCADYDPPFHADHQSPQYRADLEKCRTTWTEAVRRKNAGTPGTWIISPFTGPPEVRASIRACMTGKGYTLDNAG